jgi:hypothetical protein
VQLPPHQRVIKIIRYTLWGFVALGAVLDSVANAISLLTPLVASIGTACILLLWLLACIILPSHPLPWVFGNQLLPVRKLGIQPTAFAVGMVLLLWMPTVITRLQEHARPTKELPDVALRFVYPKSPALILDFTTGQFF